LIQSTNAIYKNKRASQPAQDGRREEEKNKDAESQVAPPPGDKWLADVTDVIMSCIHSFID
jgi:hypothetical protein